MSVHKLSDGVYENTDWKQENLHQNLVSHSNIIWKPGWSGQWHIIGEHVYNGRMSILRVRPASLLPTKTIGTFVIGDKRTLCWRKHPWAHEQMIRMCEHPGVLGCHRSWSKTAPCPHWWSLEWASLCRQHTGPTCDSVHEVREKRGRINSSTVQSSPTYSLHPYTHNTQEYL